jgi:hypothetical protein
MNNGLGRHAHACDKVDIEKETRVPRRDESEGFHSVLTGELQ